MRPDKTIYGECSVAIEDSLIYKIGTDDEMAAEYESAEVLDG